MLQQTNRDTSVVDNLTTNSPPDGIYRDGRFYRGASLSISNGLTDENKTLSDTEFCTMVDAISTIQDDKTRNKLNKILFRHMAFLLTGRPCSI